MSSAPIARAFVLGAGLGTRLKALTARRPKPLIPVAGKPLITFAFDHLFRHGVREFIVNTHHRAEAYGLLFPTGRYRDCPVLFRHEPDILETAGGIKNVADLLGGEPFVVYNGDILTDLPLGAAMERHLASGVEVTLILRSSGGPLQVSLSSGGDQVVDIGGRLGSGVAPAHLFTGTYVVSPSFLRRIPAGEKISVIPLFLDLIREGAGLGALVLDQGHWWDLGTREQYLAVHRFFRGQPDALDFPLHAQDGAGWPVWIHPEAEIEGTARIEGASAIGRGARVGPGATVRDSVLWEGAEIERDSVLDRCIVSGSCSVTGTHTAHDF